jgi:hypothetical protein
MKENNAKATAQTIWLGEPKNEREVKAISRTKNKKQASEEGREQDFSRSPFHC